MYSTVHTDSSLLFDFSRLGRVQSILGRNSGLTVDLILQLFSSSLRIIKSRQEPLPTTGLVSVFVLQNIKNSLAFFQTRISGQCGRGGKFFLCIVLFCGIKSKGRRGEKTRANKEIVNMICLNASFQIQNYCFNSLSPLSLNNLQAPIYLKRPRPPLGSFLFCSAAAAARFIRVVCILFPIPINQIHMYICFGLSCVCAG